jgi:hypothetical protein
MCSLSLTSLLPYACLPIVLTSQQGYVQWLDTEHVNMTPENLARPGQDNYLKKIKIYGQH